MARKARTVIQQTPAHITQRGNNKNVVFLENEDKALFMRLLGKYAMKYNTPVHSFCLMDNHYHIACTPPEQDSMAKLFGQLNWGYSTYHNNKYGKSGHTWQERFRSTHMTGLHLVRAMRYIEMNPVSAGLVSNPLAWNWSSARITSQITHPWFKLPVWWDSYFTSQKWHEYLLSIPKECDIYR
jgi:putative transposase